MIKWLSQSTIQAGFTLKNEQYPSDFTMALHTGYPEQDVLHNRQVVATQLGRTLDDFVCANQTHSRNVYQVKALDKGRGAHSSTHAIPETDALYTFEKNIVLTTFVADCVPVLFYTTGNRTAIGAIHSGWQGTVKEIVPATLQTLINKEDIAPTDIHIWIGPAISQQAFEVDEDVYRLYEALSYTSPFIDYRENTHKWHMDNQQIIRQQCLNSGVPHSQITLDQQCTYHSKDGFSYRENRNCGRHMGFITLAE